ncbi:MAG: signal peptidase II [Clostridia bacterium]|nr:signal peptidase II [Clostridia bacterium]
MKQKSFWIPLLAVAVLDRVIKILWAESEFVLIPHILTVRGMKNTGMAFGMLSGKPLLLAVIALAVLAAIGVYLHRHPVRGWAAAGLGMLTGGALGNLFDRIFYGYVIDMLEPTFLRLFVFNVADAGITVGAAILMICLLFGKEETKDGNA